MENKDLDLRVVKLKQNNDLPGISKLINDYMPFIVKTISDSTKSYVEVENDDELSIALIAFDEAIKKYDIEKGSFIPYAKLVILSRLKNYYAKENKSQHTSIDEIEENQYRDLYRKNENEILTDEIIEFEKELEKFGMDFVFLAENTPKHKDTREKAIEISYKISLENDLVTFTFEKQRLPIKKIAERFFVSIKFLKGSKYLIIATLIIIVKKYTQISEWIKKS